MLNQNLRNIQYQIYKKYTKYKETKLLPIYCWHIVQFAHIKVYDFINKEIMNKRKINFM